MKVTIWRSVIFTIVSRQVSWYLPSPKKVILTHIYKKIRIYISSNLTKNSFELSIHFNTFEQQRFTFKNDL